jgi:hypothetical protein
MTIIGPSENLLAKSANTSFIETFRGIGRAGNIQESIGDEQVGKHAMLQNILQ